MAEHKMHQKEEAVRYIVRVHNTDLDGDSAVVLALTNIKGIGIMLSNAICTLAKVDKNKKAGTLNDAELKRLEQVLANPVASGIPIWMANRRKDPVDGKDVHLFTSDLDFVRSNDIKHMQKIRCYKGVRHATGQPVRGQRTRSHFRKNKGKAAAVYKAKAKAAAPAAKDDKK